MGNGRPHTQTLRDTSGLCPGVVHFKDGKNDDYKLLTNVLHHKDQDGVIKKTVDITIADIETPCRSTLSGVAFTFPDKTKKIVQIIDEQVLAISTSPNTDTIVLEDKIVLAIGIRLKAEEYMWAQVTDKKTISCKQTGKLFDRYKKEFTANSNHAEAIKTLERVNIMTPENIHLNSFMYEPILDMGIYELKGLYADVCKLLQ